MTRKKVKKELKDSEVVSTSYRFSTEDTNNNISYASKRMAKLGDSVEICPECGGVIFRCFEDGSGKCGDCGIIFPSLGD